jgi:hypothetical protein
MKATKTELAPSIVAVISMIQIQNKLRINLNDRKVR